MSPGSEGSRSTPQARDVIDFAQHVVGIPDTVADIAEAANALATEGHLRHLDKALVGADKLPAGVPVNRIKNALELAEDLGMAVKDPGGLSKIGKGLSGAGVALGALGFAEAASRGDTAGMIGSGADAVANAIGLAGPLGATLSASYSVTTMAADVAWEQSEGFRNFELGIGKGIVTGLQFLGIDLMD
jgi:hypothetical protein